jgi:CHASE2 domain-containing protein
MTIEESKTTEDKNLLDAELRKDLRKLVVMSLPTLLFGMAIKYVGDRSVNHPETVILFILPGIAMLAVVMLRATIRKKFMLGWPFLVFLSIYILTFSFAAYTGVLDWKRKLIGYDDAVPQNFLALNYYGDWHYEVVSQKPALNKLVIVLMKPPESYEQGRLDVATLLAISQSSGAVGVAVDSFFVKYVPENEEDKKGIDEILCMNLDDARNKGLKVFVAYDFNVIGDYIDVLPVDPDLAKCLPEADQGHMAGYAESDGLIRSIPLYFANDPAQEALSLKVARVLDSKVNPTVRLLQFTEFKTVIRNFTLEELKEPDADRSVLNRRFVLAGEDSEKDSFQTPFGKKHGVEIHAYAIQSLLQNRFIKRPPAWLSMFMIAVWCYLLMVFAARGVANLKLILINAAFSAFTVAISALAMGLCLTWIDVIYPLLAAWLFLLLLIALRRIGRIKTRAVAG